MRKVWDEWGGGTVETAVIQPIIRRRAGSPLSSEPVAAPAEPAVTPTATVSASHSIPFRKHTGEVVFVDAKIGENLKDVAQRGGLEEIEATCGGKCECATCHAYLANPAASSSPDDGSAVSIDASTHASESNLNDPPRVNVLPTATEEESGECRSISGGYDGRVANAIATTFLRSSQTCLTTPSPGKRRPACYVK